MARARKLAQLKLRLYVAGSAPNSVRAIANARAACDEHFAAGHDLEIVDLLTHPRKGVIDGIIVTPTLLRLSPLPERRLIGDLSDKQRLLLTLGSA